MALTQLQPAPPTFTRPINPYRPPEPHAMVERVEPGSIAEEIGIQPGDEIVSINGERMEDVIDYRFLISDEDVQVEIAPGGRRDEAYVADVVKSIDETLGVAFTADVFDGIRICTNFCDFCFVYQNRRGMRKSVYIKDDDYRLSFLHGDFITLTNLTERCWERIFRYGLSPLYVSIHATDPDTRVAMLRNPEGARLREHLERLFDHGIQIHGQIVLTPGINDGHRLDQTVEEMARYFDHGCRSLAIVPVGLTGQRGRLPALRTVTRQEARTVVLKSRYWQKQFLETYGARFVYPSDEMYLLAELPLPGPAKYEELAQVENGVGLISRFRQQWRRLAARFPDASPETPGASSTRVGVLSGTLAAPVLEAMLAPIRERCGLDVRVIPIRNDFFGPSVTVSGLLTGQDIRTQVGEATPCDHYLLPENATREGWLIDDIRVEQLELDLGVPIRVVPATARGLAHGLFPDAVRASRRA